MLTIICAINAAVISQELSGYFETFLHVKV